MAKKYFWLKLRDDFFNQKEVKKLRKIAGGDTFTIIYLKMQLLSVKKGGILEFEGTERSLSEQLSLELDEDEDNINITLNFLHSNNLIEKISDSEFLMPKTVENIGSESGSAERMRRMREKKASQCDTYVTDGDKNVTTDIDIDIDIDNISKDIFVALPIQKPDESVTDENEIDKILKAWNNTQLKNIKALNKNTKRYRAINARLQEYGLQTVLDVINIANQSDFLKGDSAEGWIATFDWFIESSNFIKVMEGNYANRKGRPKQKQLPEEDKKLNEKLAARYLRQHEEYEKQKHEEEVRYENTM